MPFIKNVAIFARKSPVSITIPILSNGIGSSFTLYISDIGRSWGWGNNSSGQIGNNTITVQETPVSVLGAVKTFCKISRGDSHTVSIDKNGRAWSWGNNNFGQLGNNSTTSQRTPVSVLGAVKTFCQISAGELCTLTIDKNGRAWGWGRNNNGQLGDNTTTNKCTPVSVLGAVKTFCKIDGGASHAVAIDKNGRAWSWGYNVNGELGNNTTVSQLTPVSVAGAVKTFCEIVAGFGHNAALDKNGRSWSWGLNNNGQLGDNTTTNKCTPVSVLGAVKTFCKIFNGYNFTIAIDKNGRAWGWGRNANGQLGDNSITQRNTPVSVAGTAKTFCTISGGNTHTIGVDNNGRVWAWGDNFSNGTLGNASATSRATPVSVRGAVKTFCKIVASMPSSTSIAIDKNGRVWGWGRNTSGIIGDNTTTDRLTPVSIAGATKTFCKIAGGGNTAIAIARNGRAWSWGANSTGQLGDNTITAKCTPVSVAGAVKTFCEIALAARNGSHASAIDKNGRAWSWGNNNTGQLGNNSITSQRTPVSVLGAVKTFCKIATGLQFATAIDKNGRVWAWGVNNFGQLGNNSTTSQRTPVSVLGAVKTFCQIASGGNFSIAIDKNGRAWAWGDNTGGQLGNNSTTSQITPVSVLGAVKTFCEIASSHLFALAIDKNGRAWGWGNNSSAQLGDNTTTNRCTPVSVLGAVKTFCKISVFEGHAIAIDKNGRSWGWGINTASQLGTNNIVSVRTPVRVCTL